jgi:hypothetical protein
MLIIEANKGNAIIISILSSSLKKGYDLEGKTVSHGLVFMRPSEIKLEFRYVV